MCKRQISLFLTAVILFSVFFIPAAEASATNVTQITTVVSGGMSHSIALKDDGTVWTWGSNQQWQLGSDEDVAEQSTPKQVEGISSIVSVSAGYDFSVALKDVGSVHVFGPGGDAPIYQVAGLAGIVAVAAGQADGLALDKDGAVWHWAVGYRPSKISALKDVTAVASGGRHFLALTSSGEVWAWGANWSGQLGNGSMNDSEVPRKVANLVNIVSIAAGYSHSLAVANDGGLYAWGSNTYGQLGDGTTEARVTPVRADGIANVVTASAGNETSMALTAKNEIYTWGYGEYGQRGDNSVTISKNTPAKIETEGTPIFISSGVYHNFYVSDSGNLYAWGRNRNSQLGTGTTSNELAPQKMLSAIAIYNANSTGVAAGTNVVKLSDIEGTLGQAEIEFCQFLGIITGNPDGTYLPGKDVNRAEFAAIITRTMGVPESTLTEFSTSSFKDTSGYSWAVPYLAYCQSKGIMIGDGNGNAMPGRTIKVSEAMTMICRVLGYVDNSELLTGSWPENYIALARKLWLYDKIDADAKLMTKEMSAIAIYNSLTVQKVSVASDGKTALLWLAGQDGAIACFLNTGLGRELTMLP